MRRAGDYLSDVSPEECFHLYDGSFVRNLNELLIKIQSMSDNSFGNHVGKYRDDFIPWIQNSIGDKTLVAQLMGVKKKTFYEARIAKRIRRLELGETLIKSSMFLGSQVKKKTIRYGPLFVFSMILFMVFQVGYLTNLHFAAELQIREVALKMDNFIVKQLIADNVLFKHLVGIEHLLNLTVNKTTYMLESNFSSSPFLFPGPLSPQNRIDESQIRITNRSFSVIVNNPQWSRISDTKSMEPVLMWGANSVGIIPKDVTDIGEGDIISYQDVFNDTVIHRVMEVGYDEEGWFAVTKGDSNYYEDPFKVRFSQVRRILIAIIY